MEVRPMDIAGGVTVEGVVAVVSLVLGVRAEARARAERRRGDAAKTALACYKIVDVLKVAGTLTVDSAARVSETQSNRSLFMTLSEKARQAVAPVAERFPEGVGDLDEVQDEADALSLNGRGDR
jgi:hypothetical protein